MKIEKVMEYVEELFPHPEPELYYETDFQMLVAVLLSAQCTDKRTTAVCKVLFAKYPDAKSMSGLSQSELEKLIYSTGFYHNKAKNILAISKILVENGNNFPKTAAELEKLPGVGRKTANVVASALFGEKVMGVDTHVLRVTNRLGLVKAKTPLDVELQWYKKYPQYSNHDCHFRLVLFGRYYCTARNPKCDTCKLKDECPFYKKVIKP